MAMPSWDFSFGCKKELLCSDVFLVSASGPSTKASTGEGGGIPFEASIGEDIGLVGSMLRARSNVDQRRRVNPACDLVCHSIGCSSWKTTQSVKQVGALASHGVRELEQTISTIRDVRVLKRPEEVCVIVGYELRRYPEQDVHGGIVFPQVVQINISSTLSIS